MLCVKGRKTTEFILELFFLMLKLFNACSAQRLVLDINTLSENAHSDAIATEEKSFE